MATQPATDLSRQSDLSQHGFTGSRRRLSLVPAEHTSQIIRQGTKSDRKAKRRRQAMMPSAAVQGSVVARPYLLTAKTAWAGLDFGVALVCGSAATVLHVGGRSLVSLTQAMPAPASPWLATGVYGVLFAVCLATLARISGLHQQKEGRTGAAELLLVVQSVCVAAFGVYGAMHFFAFAAMEHGVLPVQIATTAGTMFLVRRLYAEIRKRRFARDIAVRNILIVGADTVGREARDYLTSLSHAGYRFKGFVTLDDGVESGHAASNEVVGGLGDVIALARSMFVDEIIFSRRPLNGTLAGVLDQARAVGIDVRLIPSLTETLQSRGDVQYIGDLPTIVLHQRTRQTVSLTVKRVVDIVFGGLGMVVLSPVFAAIAIAIKLQSPGPVFYGSERIGHKGRAFKCFKFRTMVPDAEALKAKLAHLNERNDILFKIAKDPRVTPIGAVLRKYSIDELPQLWNVVKGDMSLVGPRPSIRSEVAQYETPHLRRLDVVPGMTGLWQVEARRDPSFDTYVSLDSKYVSDWSLWLDLKIILRTVNVVIGGTGV